MLDDSAHFVQERLYIDVYKRQQLHAVAQASVHERLRIAKVEEIWGVFICIGLKAQIPFIGRAVLLRIGNNDVCLLYTSRCV